MDIFVVGDENTILGFSLVSVEGEVVENVDEARAALDDAVQREGVKIILVTERWANKMRDKVDQLRMEMAEPLVLDIPGSEPAPQGPSLRELVEEAMGIAMERAGGS